MRSTLAILAMFLAFTMSSSAWAKDVVPATKKVCHDVTEKGKTRSVCKTVKVHKKAAKVTNGDPNTPVKKK